MKKAWFRNKTETMWLEIGLAVALILCLGVAGIREKKSFEIQPPKDVVRQKEEIAKKVKETPKETEEVIAAGQYPIMGKSSVTEEDMIRYFQASGKVYPADALAKGGAESLETFCRIYIEEAEAEGIRPEVAFAQTMKETGFLQYGGDASIEQFNFAGLGTTGGGVPGNSYPDVRTGVRAQIQHLKAYATTDVLSQACVDERYEYVIKGSAPYVEWLGKNENPEGQGWATAEGYGYSIVEMIQKMKR